VDEGLSHDLPEAKTTQRAPFRQGGDIGGTLRDIGAEEKPRSQTLDIHVEGRRSAKNAQPVEEITKGNLRSGLASGTYRLTSRNGRKRSVTDVLERKLQVPVLVE